MNWSELTQETRDVMEELGNFKPTNTSKNKEIKGYKQDGEGTVSIYYNSSDLRIVAAACIEVAEFLDKRAECLTN